MVTRSQILCIVGAAVITIAIVQIYLSSEVTKIHPIHAARLKSSAYNMVSNFVKQCDDAGIHCIMVDPWILRALVKETFEDGHSPCRHMCKNHVYTFAIRDSDFMRMKLNMLPKLKKAGSEMRSFYDQQVTSDIATHVHIRDHENHAIHVVIFHHVSNWWWYGPDPADSLNLAFSKHEGALNDFEYDFKVTLDGIEMYMPHYPKRFVEDYDQSRFIPCNKTRADLFHKQYPRDEGHDATQFRNAAAKAIKVIKSRLDEFGVPFWLSSGTLLGWFRQCDFIPYSVDVDIGVFIKDHHKNLLSELKGSMLALEHKFGKIEDSLQYAFDMGPVKLDIFFFYEDKVLGKIWNGGTDYDNGEKFKYMFDKFTLCWTEISEMKVRVPCKTERYIENNYGPNWFRPVKKWDWKTSPFNVHPNGYWKDDELDEVIQMWDKKGKRVNLDWKNDEL